MFSETLEPVEAGCGVMDGEDQPASTSAVGEKVSFGSQTVGG